MKIVGRFVTTLSVLTACVLFGAVLSPALAATLLVDNNPNHQAEYTTLQAAIDGAAAGDTILVGPSFLNTSYGNGLVEKKLFIYGTGYLLKENGYPEIDFPSKVGSIDIQLKKDAYGVLESNPSGSKISGLYATSNIEINHGSSTAPDEGTYVISGVIISRNNVANVYIYDDYSYYAVQHTYSSAVVVSGNYIRSNAKIGDGNSATLAPRCFVWVMV